MINYLKETFASIKELYTAQKGIHKTIDRAVFYTIKCILTVKYNDVCNGLYWLLLSQMGIIEKLDETNSDCSQQSCSNTWYKVTININKNKYILVIWDSIPSPTSIISARDHNNNDILEEVLAIDNTRNSIQNITPSDLNYEYVTLETILGDVITIKKGEIIELKDEE